MLTTNVGFEGNYANLTKFVNLLDKSPRFMIIENMQASAPQQQGGQSLNVSLKIDTFVKDDSGGHAMTLGTSNKKQIVGPGRAWRSGGVFRLHQPAGRTGHSGGLAARRGRSGSAGRSDRWSGAAARAARGQTRDVARKERRVPPGLSGPQPGKPARPHQNRPHVEARRASPKCRTWTWRADRATCSSSRPRRRKEAPKLVASNEPIVPVHVVAGTAYARASGPASAATPAAADHAEVLRLFDLGG